MKERLLPTGKLAADLPSWPTLVWTLLLFSSTICLSAFAVFRDGMYSPLNKSSLPQKQALHDDWLNSAGKYFAAQEEKQSFVFPQGDGGDGPSTALVVMASKRRVPYIQTWAWSLLAGNSREELNKSVVTIINTQRPSSANGDDLQPLRDAGIPVLDMYKDDGGAAYVVDWKDWILDEYLCHIESLRVCDRAGTPWCIVFEEDSLLTREFLSKFREHVGQVLAARGSDAHDIGMVKLFTIDAWKGYQWPNWLPELVVIPSCLAAVLVAPCACLLAWINARIFGKRRRRTPLLTSSCSSRLSTVAKVAVIFVALVSNMVFVAVVMSRQRVLAVFESSEIHLDSSTSATSTVAVAFPLDVARRLLVYLQSMVQSGTQPWVPIDLEVYAWATKLELAVLQTSPSLAQHIGIFSSNPAKYKTTYVNQDSRFTF